MNPVRLQLSLDLLRDVNACRRKLERGRLECACEFTWCGRFVCVAESLLEQHDSDARARTDMRQTTLAEFLAVRPR